MKFVAASFPCLYLSVCVCLSKSIYLSLSLTPHTPPPHTQRTRQNGGEIPFHFCVPGSTVITKFHKLMVIDSA